MFSFEKYYSAKRYIGSELVEMHASALDWVERTLLAFVAQKQAHCTCWYTAAALSSAPSNHWVGAGWPRSTVQRGSKLSRAFVLVLTGHRTGPSLIRRGNSAQIAHEPRLACWRRIVDALLSSVKQGIDRDTKSSNETPDALRQLRRQHGASRKATMYNPARSGVTTLVAHCKSSDAQLCL